ncbi:MAG TPA: PhnD/SsuA/transferrin family substrate-binding protein, partial [Trichocoleus sp.]
NAPGRLTPLVAPVMQAERYGDKPLYFSDVVVRADSPLTGWNDLAQTVFCYNDKGSHSGYNVVRHQLLGQKPGFFSRVVQSGSHVRSLQWILEGKADCAAIDSTVLEQALRSQPDWATQLRVITSLGPFPMPPLVASRRLGEGRHRVIQQALLQPDSALQHALAQAGMRRFAPVDLALYRPVLQLHTAALAANRKFV